MIGVSPAHTSVPRWPATAPDVDVDGVSYLVLAAGRAGSEVAGRWTCDLAAMAKPVWVHRTDAPAGAGVADRLAAQLADARVGVRIMVAGPELVVLDCARAARGAGALDAEITVHVTDALTKRVCCAHCETATVAEVEVAATLTCAGCARTLVVYHHVSRRHGAYLGFMADAEVPAA